MKVIKKVVAALMVLGALAALTVGVVLKRAGKETKHDAVWFCGDRRHRGSDFCRCCSGVRGLAALSAGRMR